MRDTQPILAAYCQAVMLHRALMDRWHLVDPAAEPKSFKALVEMINSTSGRMAAMAVKLRLTNQSRYTPSAAATASKKVANARPWD